MTQEKKLVEEIDRGFLDELDDILAMYQFKSTRYVPVAGWCHIITRIAQAIARGEVKLPGEESRCEGCKELGISCIVIALSPKEEEKCK